MKAREIVSQRRWLYALLFGGRLVYTTGITQAYYLLLNFWAFFWIQILIRRRLKGRN